LRKTKKKKREVFRRQNAASCVESIHTKTKQTNKSQTKEEEKNKKKELIMFVFLINQTGYEC
jgi:predicted transcriptional regulator YheO